MSGAVGDRGRCGVLIPLGNSWSSQFFISMSGAAGEGGVCGVRGAGGVTVDRGVRGVRGVSCAR